MAKVALLFGVLSFVKMIAALIKLLVLQLSAKKLEGTVDGITNAESEYNGKKNATMYTISVNFDDGSTGIYKELVQGDRDTKVFTGQRYKFYVSGEKAHLVKTVVMEPVIQLGLFAVCVAIFLACAMIAGAL